MKLGIKHTVLFISLLAIRVIADEPVTHIVFDPQTGEAKTVQGAPPPQLVRQRQNIPVVEKAIIQDFLIDPLTGRRVREVSDMVGNVVGKTYPTEEEARKSFETAVGKIAKEMPRGKELTEEQKKTAVDALIAVNKDPNSWEFKQAFEKNPFITRADLAKELGCSERTIYRLLDAYGIVKRKPRLTEEQRCVKYLKSIAIRKGLKYTNFWNN